MFDVGFWEIVLIFVIMLIVVGPERLPQVIRTAGLWIGKARSMVASVRAEVERELNIDELRRSVMEQTDSEEFRKLADQVKEINSDLRSAGEEFRSSIDSATNEVAESLNSAQQSLDLRAPETVPDDDDVQNKSSSVTQDPASAETAAETVTTEGSETAGSDALSTETAASGVVDKQPAKSAGASSRAGSSTG